MGQRVDLVPVGMIPLEGKDAMVAEPVDMVLLPWVVVEVMELYEKPAVGDDRDGSCIASESVGSEAHFVD